MFSGDLKMKIDSTDKLRQPANPTIAPTRQRQTDFAAVFNETVQKTGGVQNSKAHSIQKSADTMMSWAVAPTSVSTPEASAHDLLDALECYQRVLSDPDASLKAVQPFVERMQKQAADVKPMIDELPDEHPIKSIIQEALLQVRQEADIFNSGHYVDKD
jgi:hypothetical protein